MQLGEECDDEPRARRSDGMSQRDGAAQGIESLPIDFADRLWITPDTRLVHVRWAPGVDEGTRTRLEGRFRLEVVRHVEDRTWRYRAGAISSAELNDLRSNPSVEDTHGFDQIGSTKRWRRLLTEWQLGPGWHIRENSIALIFWLYWTLPLAGLSAREKSVCRAVQVGSPLWAGTSMAVQAAFVASNSSQDASRFFAAVRVAVRYRL